MEGNYDIKCLAQHLFVQYQDFELNYRRLQVFLELEFANGNTFLLLMF